MKPLQRFRLAAAISLLLIGACAQKQTPPPTPPASENGFVSMRDGTRLFYRKVGSGAQPVILPADLFLHPAFNRLADGRTLYYYDMRNRGQSDAIGDSLANSIQQDVADLEALRSHFQLESFDLIGFSYLGMMVMMYANEHPERVRRVVQLGPIPRSLATEYPEHLRAGDYYAAMDTAALAELRRLRAEGLPDTNPKEYCLRENAVTRVALVGDPAHVSRLNQDLCDKPNEWPTHLAQHFARHFVSVQALQAEWSDFENFRGPVLTIHGTKDRNAAYGGGRDWALHLPQARLLTIPGAAHCAWADEPDLVFDAIAKFLGGSWPDDAEEVTEL